MAETIRKARISDVKAIHAMLLDRSDGMVLPRSLNDLYTRLRDFFVCVDETGRVVGCCALCVSWEDLAEVRSLFVRPEARGKRLGARLVDACLSEAVTLGIYRVFVLTDQVAFFARLGFEETDKEVLPQKVWNDCINCPQFPDCSEVAMLMQL